MINRVLQNSIEEQQNNIAVIAIIGARQVGKTTLSKQLAEKSNNTIFLDLEKKSDRLAISETESFLNLNKGKLICLDEIQMMPNVFSEMRNFIDNNPDTYFIITGSSSPDLLRQSSESLAGRIYYFELSPLLWAEIKGVTSLKKYRILGGMPNSILSENNNDAFIWIRNYIRTFLERDLRNFGFNIPPETLHRLWIMLAHINGQTLNYSSLSNAMGMSHTSIKYYVDVLANTFMLRIIQPYYVNIKKRLVKAPKVYFRDTGILHTLLNIDTFEELFSHPVYGTSWEVTVIENTIAKYKNWEYYYYRTANGNEIDLILTKANRVIAIEIKASTTPKLSKGFWYALEDVKATEAYVIAEVNIPYPMKKGVMVYNLQDFLNKKI